MTSILPPISSSPSDLAGSMNAATQALYQNADLYFQQKGLIEQKLGEIETNHAANLTQINQRLDNMGADLRDNSPQMISTPQTITIGASGQPSTIQDALNSIKAKVLIADVVIQIPDGEHEMTPVSFSHFPYGNHIKIRGNVENPSACKLKFSSLSSNQAAFYFNNVVGITIEGFEIIGLNRTGYGIHLVNQARIYSRSNALIIRDFSSAMRIGSMAICNASGIIIENCGRGIYVIYNGFFSGSYLQVSNVDYGIYASDASYVNSAHTVIDTAISGFVSSHHSTVSCYYTTTKNCSNYGFYAAQGGWMDATGSVGNHEGNGEDYNLAPYVPDGSGAVIQY